MNPRNLLLVIAAFILVLLAGCCSCDGAGIMDELATGHQNQVKKGEQILINEVIEGKPWPRVKVYRTVEASPEEVIAVFCDYDNAKSYVPNVLKSAISNRVSACTVDIDYGLNVPILPDEYYTTRNTVKLVAPGIYRVDWKLLRAVQTKDSVGSLRAEPFEGKALICYENLVTPGSSMAGLLKGKAIQQMSETVAAIAAHIEKQKQTNPEGLQREVEELRKALKPAAN
jgi:hypothetical protein